MKKNPIKFLKSFGLKLFLLEFFILLFTKFNIFKNLNIKLTIKKNNFINNYLEKNYSYLIEKYNSKTYKKENYSNKVWIFWWQGLDTAPDIVKFSINTIKNTLKDKEIILITKENVEDYYKIPKHIRKKLEDGSLTLTTFSDILRMNLLKDYGGFWIDSTIFLTDNPFKNVKDNFYTIKFKTDDKTRISQGLWCGFFIGGKNQPLYEFMAEFFYDYFQKEEILIDYFLIDYVIKVAYNNIPEIRNKFDEVPYNNERIHDLEHMINSKYDEKIFKKLLKDNDVHKLSYKINIENNNYNYYYYILKKYSK